MSDSVDRGDWMQTFTGRKFYPLDPREEEVHLDDIVHALSHVCRFGGHCLFHYSVAQHSVLVAKDAEHKLEALLHDAAEAYLGDIIRPLKKDHGLTRYREAESRVHAVICRRFGALIQTPADVAREDLRALATERRDVMADTTEVWSCLDGIQPHSDRILRLNPVEVRRLLYDEFEKLKIF
jgi:uncharacterized protein